MKKEHEFDLLFKFRIFEYSKRIQCFKIDSMGFTKHHFSQGKLYAQNR
jgi:hypothetical protein